MTHATPTTPIPAQQHVPQTAIPEHVWVEAANCMAPGSEFMRVEAIARAILAAEQRVIDAMQAVIEQRTELAAARRARAVRYLSEPDGVVPAAGELRWAGELLSDASTLRQIINQFR